MLGLIQRQFAELLGVSYQQICKYEHDRVRHIEMEEPGNGGTGRARFLSGEAARGGFGGSPRAAISIQRVS
jgi:hypothetical protein